MRKERLMLWLDLAQRDGAECHYCHVRLEPEDFTLDHIWPASLGGSTRRYNLVLACAPCNHALGRLLAKCRCKVCHRARSKALPQGVRFIPAA